ncbi:MAG: hypothetical protein MH472_06690 [Bacteroidia bacterium]|nr:hypothetical protein [Bacteroidia bacterium]
MRNFIIIGIILCALFSCKREKIEQGKITNPTEANSINWQIIEDESLFLPSSAFQVYEDEYSNTIIRNGGMAIEIDSVGNLKRKTNFIQNFNSQNFAFIDQGNFFASTRKLNDPIGGEYLQFYQKNETKSLFNYPIWIESRNRDSNQIYTYEYEFQDIDLLRLNWNSNNKNSKAIILAYKQNLPVIENRVKSTELLIIEGRNNSDLKSTSFEILNEGAKYFYQIKNNSQYIILSNNNSNRIFDINMKWMADNNHNLILDLAPIKDKFIIENNDLYYLSSDGIKLENNIEGLSSSRDKISSCRDSLLFIFQYNLARVVNAFTGQELYNLLLTDPRIPTKFKNKQLYYFYVNRKGMAILVYSDGILCFQINKI